jgi:betaine lipid synthase
MYASTWICTKQEDVVRPNNGRTISVLSLGDAAIQSAKRSNSVEDLKI